MSSMTDSRLAMYEGMIALAWADHELAEDEKQGLRELIDGNPRFTDAQREKLHSDVDRKITLDSVWPRITEKQDRAHLLDVAGMIFLKDGEYSSAEKGLYDDFLAKHMASIDAESVIEEMRSMTGRLRAQREIEQQELEEYAAQFSLVNRLKEFLKRTVD
jgi:hypothetical protein